MEKEEELEGPVPSENGAILASQIAQGEQAECACDPGGCHHAKLPAFLENWMRGDPGEYLGIEEMCNSQRLDFRK